MFGNIQLIGNQDHSTVISFIPDFLSSPQSTSYISYCYFNLVKYKPWMVFPETVYGGEQGKSEEDIETFSDRPHNESSIVLPWQQFLTDIEDDAVDQPDYLQRRISAMGRQEDQWTPLHEEIDGPTYLA